MIAALQAQKAAVDQQIAQLTASQPEFAIAAELEKVPGIGTVTAATLASRLVAHSFSHSDQFVAYCGLGCPLGGLGCDNRARRMDTRA